MPSWIQRKRMISRQDKIRMMWETQQRRRNQRAVPSQQVAQQQMVFNLGAGANTPAVVTAPAPAKKGCGCGMKF